VSVAAHRFDNALRYRDGDHPGQWHLTPAYVLDKVRADLGGIDLDPCTEPDNPTGAKHFYTTEDDGLKRPWCATWRKLTVFCNPPYGKAREPWVTRCIIAGTMRNQGVVLLIPSATDTRTFRRAAESADDIVFVQGRLKFGTLRENRRQHAASHPSALLGWNVSLDACAELGWRARARVAGAPCGGSGGADNTKAAP
jgi:phage N-6-adenine-methyltransferase